MFELCSDLSKTGLKIILFFLSTFKEGQINLFLANGFKKGKMATLRKISLFVRLSPIEFPRKEK
jgi:hypothetical protein